MAGPARRGAQDVGGLVIHLHDGGYVHSHPHGPWWAIAALIVVLVLVLAAGWYLRNDR